MTGDQITLILGLVVFAVLVLLLSRAGRRRVPAGARTRTAQKPVKKKRR